MRAHKSKEHTMASGRPAIVTSLKRDDVVILNRNFQSPYVVSAITEDREARNVTLMPFPAGQALNVPPVHYHHLAESNSYVRVNDGINVGKGEIPFDLFYKQLNEGRGAIVVKLDQNGNTDNTEAGKTIPDIFDAFGFQLDPAKNFARMYPDDCIAPTRYLRWPGETVWRSPTGMVLGVGAVPKPVEVKDEDVANASGYAEPTTFANVMTLFSGLLGKKRPNDGELKTTPDPKDGRVEPPKNVRPLTMAADTSVGSAVKQGHYAPESIGLPVGS